MPHIGQTESVSFVDLNGIKRIDRKSCPVRSGAVKGHTFWPIPIVCSLVRFAKIFTRDTADRLKFYCSLARILQQQ